MRCELCDNNKATKNYKGTKCCGDCLKTICLFCSTKQDKVVKYTDCIGHDVTFDSKHNRFTADKQFLAEATFSMDEE